MDDAGRTKFCSVCGQRNGATHSSCGGTSNYCTDCGKFVGVATNLVHTCSPQKEQPNG